MPWCSCHSRRML